ncbi:MAG: NUDIX domain-containing protein [Candidatus Acidiferrales bacterium]
MLVVAALIRSDNRLLVCQRKRGGAFELQWEFPGGKVGRGESLEEALERELREELDVPARIGHEIYRTRHKYKEMSEPVEVVFFAAEATPETIRNCVFERIEWRAPETLREMDFLEADRDMITLLVSGKLKL